MTGTEFGQSVLNKRGQERETAFLQAVKNGLVPRVFFDGPWVPLLIKEGGHELVVYVAPDFFAVGNETDPFYYGPWPTTAQAVADEVGALLISRKLATLIYRAAAKKLTIYQVNPGPPWYDGAVPKDIEATGAFVAANKKRNALLGGADRWSRLTAGHAKDLLVTKRGLGGSCPGGQCVTIFGGGGGATDGWAVQPLSTVHAWNYGPDYSHGLRLVSRSAVLDGKEVELASVFTDPALAYLVSDEGPYTPRLPTSASASVPSTPSKPSTPKLPLTPASNVQTSESGWGSWLVLGGFGAFVAYLAATSSDRPKRR